MMERRGWEVVKQYQILNTFKSNTQKSNTNTTTPHTITAVSPFFGEGKKGQNRKKRKKRTPIPPGLSPRGGGGGESEVPC